MWGLGVWWSLSGKAVLVRKMVGDIDYCVTLGGNCWDYGCLGITLLERLAERTVLQMSVQSQEPSVALRAGLSRATRSSLVVQCLL